MNEKSMYAKPLLLLSFIYFLISTACFSVVRWRGLLSLFCLCLVSFLFSRPLCVAVLLTGCHATPPGSAGYHRARMLRQEEMAGGRPEVPPLNPVDFAVNVISDDGDGVFKVQLLDRRADGTVIAAQVLQHLQKFLELTHFVQAVAPKFDAPPPILQDSPPAMLLQHVRGYLNAAIAFDTLSRLREVQDFVGYTELLKLERQHAAEVHHTSTALCHALPQVPDVVQPSCERRSSMPDDHNDDRSGNGGVRAQGSNCLDPVMVPMLEECFRIMDVGAAGYITLEDMKEFFGGDAGDWVAKQLQEDKPYNCRCFVAIVEAALSSGKLVHTLEECIDRYWLLQYQKIFIALAPFVNGEVEQLELSLGPINGFNPFELASLMFVVTEAGLRLVNSKEVVKWVRCGKHRCSCALTIEQLALLLDTLSKVVPFAEVWFGLQPHPDTRWRILHIISTYAAVADPAVVEEFREQIMQMRQATMSAEQCENCRLLREAVKQQECMLVEAKEANADLTVRVQNLEGRLEERGEALARLQHDYLHAQTLLLEAEIREAELVEALEKAKEQQLPTTSVSGGNYLCVSAVEAVVPKSSPSLLHLLPCGNAVTHMRGEVPVSPVSLLFNTVGAITCAIPASLSFPSELSVDVFWCGGCSETERLVCRDAAGRRSFAIVFRDGELHLFAGEAEGAWNGGGHLLRLAVRCWYHLRCLFDWQEKTICVTLTQCGGNTEKRRKETTTTTSPKNAAAAAVSCGLLAMVDKQATGIAVVDIFPRTELLLSYCNLLLHYTC